VAIFPKWKNIQKLSCFMCISISRPNQGKLTDNNSDSGLCSYVEPYRSLQWRRKIPQNTLKRLKTQQNAAKRCCITSSNKYNAKKLKKIERRLPKKIKRTKKVDLQTAIATIITNPNETWKNLKRE
jgi:hypothetical protein